MMVSNKPRGGVGVWNTFLFSINIYTNIWVRICNGKYKNRMNNIFTILILNMKRESGKLCRNF